MNPYFHKYLKVAEGGECAPFLHFWSSISATAALLARNVYTPFINTHLYPNLYVMLIGEPGSRKSTAIKLAKKLVEKSGYTHCAATKTSEAKWLLDLAKLNADGSKLGEAVSLDNLSIDTLRYADVESNEEIVESYVCHDEFGNFIGLNNYPFISLLGDFWDYEGTYNYRIKNGTSFNINNPTINILGGITPKSFILYFPPAIADQGFLSRMLIIHSKNTDKKIADPPMMDEGLKRELIDNFKAVRGLKGEFTRDAKARELLNAIYTDWNGIGDARFMTYSTRRFTQLLKLSMIFAATRFDAPVITEQDVLTANTLLSYTERLMPQALGEFGKNRNSDVAHTIMNFLDKATGPVPIKQLWRLVMADLDNRDKLLELLNGLQQADKIQYIVDKAGYLPKRAPLIKKTDQYVDWQLLSTIVDDLPLLVPHNRQAAPDSSEPKDLSAFG